MTAQPTSSTNLSPLHVQMHQNVQDIRAHGAVCNNSTDDTSSIQAAIDQVGSDGGGTVYFPGTSIKHASTLTVTGPFVWFRGEGQKTELRFTGTGKAITVGGGHAGTASTYGGFRDMMFSAGTGSACTSQIYCDMVRYYKFQNIRFYTYPTGSWTQGAVRLVGYPGESLGCWDVHVKDSFFTGSNATTAIYLWAGWYSSGLRVEDNDFDTFLAAIRVENGSGIKLSGNEIENPVTNGKGIHLSSPDASSVLWGVDIGGNRYESHATGTSFLSVDEAQGGNQCGSIHLHGNETYNNANTANTVVLNNPNADFHKMRLLSEGNWNTGIATGTAVHKLYTAKDVAYVLANTGDDQTGLPPTQVDTNGGAGVATTVAFPA